MKIKNLLTVLALASALLLNSCNSRQTPPADTDDTDLQTQQITDTAPIRPAPMPAETEDTEKPADETVEVILPAVTEAVTEAPTPELPPEEETADETEADEEPTQEQTQDAPQEPTPAVPAAKQTIVITEPLVPGGIPVTGHLWSAQSDHIRLLLDYALFQNTDGTVMLTLDVGLSCYELWCSAKPDMGTITVNGVSRTFSTDAIDHMVSEKTYIPFLSQNYDATNNQSVSVDVSWNYNGTYGGTAIGTLSVGMTLQWDDTVIASPTTPVAPPDEFRPTEPDVPSTEIPAEPAETDAPTEPTEPAVPVDPTEPTAPTESTDPADPVTPVEPEVTTPPADDTTPVPDVPPTEIDPPAVQEPTVTGTPEETVSPVEDTEP